MIPLPNHDGLLRSWKEIAAYLGVDKRTCLRWEIKKGLPIHRVEGEGKGSIFAYKEELDRWMMDRKAGGSEHPPDRTGDGDPAGANGRETLLRRWVEASPRIRHRLAIFHLSIWVLLCSTVALILLRPTSRVPHQFKIDGSALVILNGSDRELWRKDLGVADLKSEAFYRSRYQVRQRDETELAHFPCLVMRDINGDGKVEVLFVVKASDETHEGLLFCFDERGNEMWQFKAGRVLKFGERTLPADYRIDGLEVLDLDRNGRSEIIFYATHKPEFPCQLVILDTAGRVLGEYWNSGHWSDLQAADLNGDGRNEIIASGVNNDYGCGALAVFDPQNLSGISPQLRPEYRCESFKPGSEKFYILLPRVEGLRPDAAIEAASILYIRGSGEIEVIASLSRLYFRFAPSLERLGVSSSHDFLARYTALQEKNGKIPHPDAAFLEAMAARILYWDGAAKVWTPKLAMSNKW